MASSDLLGLETFRKFIKNQILNGFGRSPIGIAGSWGVGKTHFLLALKKDLEAENHVVVYIDAWEADYISEPLISIVSEITSHPKISLNLKLDTAKKSIRSAANKIRIFGLNLLVSRLSQGKFNAEEVGKFFAASNIFKESIEAYEAEKNLTLELKSLFETVIKQLNSENGGQLILLIDELDRCDPAFAVQLLERIKHIFDVPGIKILVAFDQDQLMATIRHYYGQDFDSQTYLEKFFPYIQKMPLPTRKVFISAKLAEDEFQKAILAAQNNIGLPNFSNFMDVFIEIADKAEMSLRKIQSILIRIGTAISQDNPSRIDPIIALALIYLREADRSAYEQFQKGSSDFSLIQKHFEQNEKLKQLGNINLFKYMEALMYFQDINAHPQRNLNPNNIIINSPPWFSLPQEIQDKLNRVSVYQSLQPIAHQYLNVEETILRLELTNF